MDFESRGGAGDEVDEGLNAEENQDVEDESEGEDDYAAFASGPSTMHEAATGVSRPRQASSNIDPVFLLRDFFRIFAPSRVDEARPLIERAFGEAAKKRGDKQEPAEEGEDTPALSLEVAEDEALLQLFASLEEQYGAAAIGFFSEERFRICFSSALFEPLRALYDPSALPPYPLIRPLDNIHKAQLLLPNGSLQGGGGSGSGGGGDDAAVASMPVISGVRGAGSSIAKSMMAHLAPRIGVLHTKERADRDKQWRSGALQGNHLGSIAKTLEAMDREGRAKAAMAMMTMPMAGGSLQTVGPLLSLSEWHSEKRRVRLLVCVPVLEKGGRGPSSSSSPTYQRVRTGVIVGRLTGVDAYWNLLLTGDCRTVWLPGTRKVKRPEVARQELTMTSSASTKTTTAKKKGDDKDDGSDDSDSDSIVAGGDDTFMDKALTKGKLSASSTSSSSSVSSLVRAANRQALMSFHSLLQQQQRPQQQPSGGARGAGGSSGSISSSALQADAVAASVSDSTNIGFKQLIVKGEWVMSITSIKQQQQQQQQQPSRAGAGVSTAAGGR
jgi:hypothetical protein